MMRVAILAMTLAAPCAAAAQGAQSVRVQAFTLRPPSRINLTAVAGQLQWRSCATCPPEFASSLMVIAGGEEVRLSTGEHGSELSVEGHYRLSGDAMPSVAGSHPITVRSRENHLQIVFSMPLEDYVAAVLAAEGGDLRGDDARKAMAVAVRTYAARFHSRHTADGFDFCDTTHCQVVRWDRTDAHALAAAASTQGEILAFGGSPAATYYHQNCGGTIAAAKEVWPDSGEPYLPTHPDPYCLGREPTAVGIDAVGCRSRCRYASVGTKPAPRLDRQSKSCSVQTSGRAQKLRLAGGSSPTFIMSASSLRYAVGRTLGWNKIRSDLYDVRAGAAGLTFFGRGAGHGVGLCQAGAEQMSLQGKGYREILSFYYPGTQVAKSPEIQWQQRFSDRFELDSTTPEQDAFVLPIAARLLKQDEDAAGWKVTSAGSPAGVPDTRCFSRYYRSARLGGGFDERQHDSFAAGFSVAFPIDPGVHIAA